MYNVYINYLFSKYIKTVIVLLCIFGERVGGPITLTIPHEIIPDKRFPKIYKLEKHMSSLEMWMSMCGATWLSGDSSASLPPYTIKIKFNI